MQLPNVLGFVLGLLQMLLYAIYRKGDKKSNKMEKNPAEALKNIVVASPLGTGEVFPVEEDEETKKSQVVEREEKKNQECEV